MAKKKADRRKDATTNRVSADGLDMDDDEVFRIIGKSDVLGGQFASASSASGPAYEILRPSQLDAAVKQSQAASTSEKTSTVPKLVELIDSDETGIAADPAAPQRDAASEEEAEISEYGEEVFRLILNMIVFGTLWLCLDIMIHAQYGQEATIKGELGRAVNVLPGLAFVVYLTSHYSTHLLTKLVLFAFSAVGGSHMIYCVNTQSYLAVMKRCPALGTLWIWSIVQLDLTFAVASLAAVAGYVKWRGLHIITT